MMTQSKIEEPIILIIVKKIVEKNTPLIVARALSKHLANKFNDKITQKIRKEVNFNESSHRRLFHKNQALNKCNCVHCQARQSYVDSKLVKHRTKKNLYSDVPFTDGEYDRIMSTLNILDDQVKHRKQDVLTYARRLEI